MSEKKKVARGSMAKRPDAKKLERRIKRALDYALRFGGIDGSHHKTWVLDQMVRALTGCTKPSRSDSQGESEEYRKWVKRCRRGEHGPETYSWDTGIAP